MTRMRMLMCMMLLAITVFITGCPVPPESNTIAADVCDDRPIYVVNEPCTTWEFKLGNLYGYDIHTVGNGWEPIGGSQGQYVLRRCVSVGDPSPL